MLLTMDDRPPVTSLFTDIDGSARLWAENLEAVSASLLVHDLIGRRAIE
jgi:class 3 adenylate cyclase